MAPAASPPPSDPLRGAPNPTPLLLAAGDSLKSLAVGLLSRLSSSPSAPSRTPKAPSPPRSSAVAVPFLLPASPFSDRRSQNPSSVPQPAVRSLSPGVRIEGLSKGGGGPAFVGQVFTMLDPSGNGLMAVTTHFDIPFLSKRTPEWLKRMFAAVTKSETNGPVFRFFMDLNDAVSYVKQLNIPTGMVGACRLDVAYEHFKEKPHMFQFVPNEKQVRAANKLLKAVPQKGRRRKLDGVPVFSAQNLNIAIATNNGTRWYTPYFFDKNLLDNILEASIDQHFHSMIQSRHAQRRRDVIDDSITTEMVEESGESLFEPPEVQELLDEMGQSGIPLSVISKAAEIQLLDVVDKVLLGNKWLRKATGIQPKFPYLVESFEERSAAAFTKSAVSTRTTLSEGADCCPNTLQPGTPEVTVKESAHEERGQSASHANIRIPLSNWLPSLWPGQNERQQHREPRAGLDKDASKDPPANPLLPKIMMVGISMGEGGQMSKANIKKTMEDLTRELEQASQKSTVLNEDNDPLFVANVGDYSKIARVSSSQ